MSLLRGRGLWNIQSIVNRIANRESRESKRASKKLSRIRFIPIRIA